MTFPTEAERQARLHKRAGCCTEEEAMNLIELARHEQGSIFCPGHGALIKDLADEVEGLREVVERLTFFQIQNKELREALEAIADGHTPYRMDKEEYFRDAALQFRDTARVALGKPPSEKGESDG